MGWSLAYRTTVKEATCFMLVVCVMCVCVCGGVYDDTGPLTFVWFLFCLLGLECDISFTQARSERSGSDIVS